MGYLLLKVDFLLQSFMWESKASFQPSHDPSVFQSLDAEVMCVKSKGADPSCNACFDQTLPLAWQIGWEGALLLLGLQTRHVRPGAVNACITSNANKQAQRQETRGFGNVAWCEREEACGKESNWIYNFRDHKLTDKMTATRTLTRYWLPFIFSMHLHTLLMIDP